MSDVRIVAAGDAALVAEFEERIDAGVNARVVALADRLQHEPEPGVLDIVPAYRSVTVYFDPLRIASDRLEGRLRSLCADATVRTTSAGTLVHLPVCYDAEFGLDLGVVCAFSGLGVGGVVEAHVAREYRVFMLGFVPGFPYLGTVDARIAAPRRSTPRTAVPAGSVAVAGQQTGIYPCQTPGGWNVIGRTPLNMLSLDRPVPTRVAAGDRVRFHPIDRAAFDRIGHRQEFTP